MLLAALTDKLTNARITTRGAGACPFEGMTPDARQVTPGMVFFALPDALRGNPYQAFAAAERGAAAVICEASTALPPRFPRVEVADVRTAYAEAASLLHGQPAGRLALFGILSSSSPGDGTRRHASNVVAILAQLLRAAGHEVAQLDELGCTSGGRVMPRPVSGLDAMELHGLLAQHVKAGGTAAVVELTEATSVNLPGVVWVKRSVGTAQEPLPDGTVLTWRGLRLPQDDGSLLAPLAGRGNAIALRDALGYARAAGLSRAQILAGIARLRTTPGFMEPVHAGQPFAVFVDAARSAAELAEVLADARTLARARVILVTGAPAELSTAGRVELGRTAAAADRVFVTADNPRLASVSALSAQMTSAAPASRFLFEPDRTRAIRSAVRVAGPDDIVVIAGKGHRRSQEIGGSVLPCDDRRTASAALAACGHRAATDDE